MKHQPITAIFKTSFVLTFLLFAVPALTAQNNAKQSAISALQINIGNNRYYIIYYKDSKPDDVPQEAYDGLWEIQKEVIDNFTYDYDVYYGRKKHQYLSTKEDFYNYGKGGGGHAWLEYRTEENTYIIDPTWSDDYIYTQGKDTKKKYRESPAYGKQAFFITYDEDKKIFSKRSHSSYNTGKSETPL